MKMFKTLLIASLICAAGATTAAYASDASCAQGEHAWKMDPAKRAAFFAKHQQMLHDKLKIQPEQEAAWKTFSDAVKPMDHMMEHKPDLKASAPEAMQARVDMMQKHLDMLQKRSEATKTFYQQLNPEQKKVFDEEARHWGWHKHHGMHHHWQHHAASAAN